MAWIESHTVLVRHKKLRDLARDLRVRPSYAMGHLHALWHAALEQREDGDLTGWSDEFIAESSDFPGDAPQYVRLLQQHRWLDGKIIHDWVDYAGLFLTRKYSTSNPDKLKEIWAKHGRVYGANGKRAVSEQLPLAPNPTDLPNPPNQVHCSAKASLTGALKVSDQANRLADTAVKIYEAYPRKVGRPKAIASILRCLSKHSADDLLARTLAFATAVKRWPVNEMQYVPHPTTWFNQERFNDDPSTWEKTPTVQQLGIPIYLQIRSLEEEIAKHPANRESVAHNPNCTPEQKEHLKNLRARLKALTAAK